MDRTHLAKTSSFKIREAPPTSLSGKLSRRTGISIIACALAKVQTCPLAESGVPTGPGQLSSVWCMHLIGRPMPSPFNCPILPSASLPRRRRGLLHTYQPAIRAIPSLKQRQV